MPRGPKGQERPRDTNQLAKLTVGILTGEVEDREPYRADGGCAGIAAAAPRRTRRAGGGGGARTPKEAGRALTPFLGHGSRATPACCCAQYAIVEYWQCDALGLQGEFTAACR